jgi:hypothetical protein
VVLLEGAASIAVPTTQSPADRFGQGGGPLHRPRFTHVTNARIAAKVEWNEGCQSWIWTSNLSLGVVSAMDEETEDLIAQLCTRAGIIMEDTSVRALMVATVEPARRQVELIEVERQVQCCLAILSAARSLRD